MNAFNENTVELAALEYFAELGYRTGYGPVDAAVGDVREKPSDVVLWGRVEDALRRLNPGASPQMVGEALKRMQRAE